VAYHGQLLNIPVMVVMPRFAPLIKVANCRGFGAQVMLHGESLSSARQHALTLGAERQLTYIQGFDDDAIIAGAGTVGLEILEDVPEVDAIVVPVGGGGLIAGIAAAVKPTHPHVRIIGVESVSAPTLSVSLEQQAVTPVETQATLADGLAVAEVGKRCFDIARRWVDRVALVDETAIAKAVLRLLEMEKMVLEGAGAVGLAAMMQSEALGLAALRGRKVVLVLSGGNIDITTLGRVIDRGLAGDGRLMRVAADISDRPGGLAQVLAVIAQHGGSILEVHHDRHFGPPDVALVRIGLVIETRDAGHIAQIHEALAGTGVVLRTT